MKIILFIDNLGSGGAQRQLVGLSVLLKQRGYDVQVAVYQDIPFFAGYLNKNNVPFFIIPNAASYVRRIPLITRYFRQQNPDWVIAYQESPSTFACIAKLFGGQFRLIVSERNTTQRVTWREIIRFFLYRFADWIVPNSFSQEKFIKSFKPNLCRKIKTITNFVDLERFHPNDYSRKTIPEITVAASLWASKNAIGFIEGVRLAKNQGHVFHVSWYGKTGKWNNYIDKCEELIEKYNLREYIGLHDKTNEIEKIYNLSDYFCLPSFYEGTPNVICEAIACGLPVICSNVCDNGIYVQDGVNGILFDPQDPQDISDALIKIISLSEIDYQKFRNNSRSIAEQLLSPCCFINKYIQLMEI